MRVLFLIAFTLISTYSFGQIDESLPVREGTYLATITPLSSPEQIDKMLIKLREQAKEVTITDMEYTKDGYLKKFNARMVSYCMIDEPFVSESKVDFSRDNFIFIISIFENCSAGLMSSTIHGYDDLMNAMFKKSRPETVAHSWSADFTLLEKHLVKKVWN